MKNTLLAIFIVLVLSPKCSAEDSLTKNKFEWQKPDTAYQIVYTTFHVVDWLQSRYISKHPEEFYEKNRILGKQPSIGKVNSYFAVTLAGHLAISYFLPYVLDPILPEKYARASRRVWQIIWIGVELDVTGKNFAAGVKIDF
jgi:hypothetical protein